MTTEQNGNRRPEQARHVLGGPAAPMGVETLAALAAAGLIAIAPGVIEFDEAQAYAENDLRAEVAAIRLELRRQSELAARHPGVTPATAQLLDDLDAVIESTL